jgi:hypothetical protein
MFAPNFLVLQCTKMWTNPYDVDGEIKISKIDTCTSKVIPMKTNDCWLIDIYCFTCRSWIFHLYGDVTTEGEGLQILGLCTAHRTFEQGRMFIVPHYLWHGASVVLRVFGGGGSSEGPPTRLLSRYTRGCVDDPI